MRSHPEEKTQASVRGRILRAALTMLVLHGTRQTKSAQIAAEAGVSESTVFRYYKDVEGVLRAVYDDCWGQINSHLYRASFQSPSVGDPTEALLDEFDHLWQLREASADLKDAVTVAFTFYRRPAELGLTVPPENLQMFENRIETLCSNALSTRGAVMKPRALQEVLTNFAVTVWLTWRFMPQGSDDLSVAEARMGIRGLLDAFVTSPVGQVA